jgi:hypothetical protein
MIIETLRPMTIPGTGQIGAHEVFNAIAIGEFTVGIRFKEKHVVLTNGHKADEWREVRARVTPTVRVDCCVAGRWPGRRKTNHAKPPMKIEKGHPFPIGRYVPESELGRLRELINKMKPATGSPEDESFLYTGSRRDSVHQAAKTIGATLKTRKENGGVRVWRKS